MWFILSMCSEQEAGVVHTEHVQRAGSRIVRTGHVHFLYPGVGGEDLAHELHLLLPEVILQVIHQHHEAGLLQGHHLAENFQLKHAHRQACTDARTHIHTRITKETAQNASGVDINTHTHTHARHASVYMCVFTDTGTRLRKIITTETTQEIK